ncbi:MAG: hypothetical protein QW429_04955 [Thermoprotei archaeon]
MLERLKARIEQWLAGIIDRQMAQALQMAIEHPEVVDRFMPMIDRIIDRQIERFGKQAKEEGGKTLTENLPIEALAMRALPRELRPFAPFIMPLLQGWLQKKGVSGGGSTSKNPFE